MIQNTPTPPRQKTDMIPTWLGGDLVAVEVEEASDYDLWGRRLD